MEHVSGPKVLQDGELKTGKQIAAFFEVYEEYKRNCLNHPWLPKPQRKLSPGRDLKILAGVAKKIKPDSPFRREDDLALVERHDETARGGAFSRKQDIA